MSALRATVAFLVLSFVLAVEGTSLASTTAPAAATASVASPESLALAAFLNAPVEKLSARDAYAANGRCLQRMSAIFTAFQKASFDTALAVRDRLWLEGLATCRDPALDFPNDAWSQSNLGLWLNMHPESADLHRLTVKFLSRAVDLGIGTWADAGIVLRDCNVLAAEHRTGEYLCYPSTLSWAKSAIAAFNQEEANSVRPSANGSTLGDNSDEREAHRLDDEAQADAVRSAEETARLIREHESP